MHLLSFFAAYSAAALAPHVLWFLFLRSKKTYADGWRDGVREVERHLAERAETALALAPAGTLPYANLRSLAFLHAAADAAEIRRRRS